MTLEDGGGSPAVDIPRPASSYGDIRELVESPEQYFFPFAAGPTSSTGNTPLTTTPRLNYLRSIPSSSSSSNPSRRGMANSLDTNTTSPRHPLSSHLEGREEREWTLFGELMRNEGTSHSSRVSSRSSRSVTPTGPKKPRPNGIDHTNANAPLSAILQRQPPSPATVIASSNAGTNGQPSGTVRPSSSVASPDHDSSDTESGYRSSVACPKHRARWWSISTLPTLSPLQRNILKCCVAYFIASLFTFSPYLSGLIADITGDGPGEKGPSPSGHMVSTIAVYYNPAKTLGGMVDADLYCLMGLFVAAFISLSSMSMYWFFELQPGWEWLADSLVILWIGLGMSAIAWMKVWMAKPTFNTACSMMAIIIFVVVVREGGLDTLLQVSLIVLVGAAVSNLVCFLLWPQRATRNLQGTMTKTLESFSTLLTTIIETFLLEDPDRQPNQEKLQRAIESHQASFTALKKNLAEAQSEWAFGGPSKPSQDRGSQSRRDLGQAYEDAVDSLNRLGQHLNGLRDGTSLQFEFIKATRDGKVVLKSRGERRTTAVWSDGVDTNKGKKTNVDGQTNGDTDDKALLQAAADMFGDMVDDLGPPLKALSGTCSTTLKRLRDAGVQPRPGGKDPIPPQEFRDLAYALERALFTFESTSDQAIMRLYRSGHMTGTHSMTSSLSSLPDENPLTSGTDNENIFLVYFFIFTLQEFAKELISLVDAMSRIYNIQQAEAAERWQFLRRPSEYIGSRSTSARSRIRSGRPSALHRRFSAYFSSEPAHKAASFPKVRPHAPNTMQTPARSELPFWGRVGQTIWAIGARLKEQDMKYAFKAGMATAILAAPAFFDSTRPLFTEYRGEWALISFFVVISRTIGATNFLGVHRVLGTLLGAIVAAAIWTIFPENPYVLSIFGFFFSIPCFYYIVAFPQYAASGRFVLLTYNLTCLYCYNIRQHDVSIVDIAFHRFVAVTVGVVWAAIVSRYWWPTEARRELSRALGEFCLNTGWLYTRLVAFNSFADDSPYTLNRIDEDSPDTETSALLRPTNDYLSDSIKAFMAMELHLQIKLIELQGLLAQTQHEPRLKGPFPVKLYRSILTSLQTILDKLHSMRCVTSREEWHTTVTRDFIIPVNKERREMVGNIILYFSVLAGAFRLKSPLPPYLPPAEGSRQRLVGAIRELDIVKNRNIKGSRQLLFFAYALTMRGVTQELDYLGRTLQDAFGVIGGSTEAFEALFRVGGNPHEVA